MEHKITILISFLAGAIAFFVFPKFPPAPKTETLWDLLTEQQRRSLNSKSKNTLTAVPAIPQPRLSEAAIYFSEKNYPNDPGYVFYDPDVRDPETVLHEALHALDRDNKYSKYMIPDSVTRDMLYRRYHGRPPKYTMENHIPTEEMYATAGQGGIENIPKSLIEYFKDIFVFPNSPSPKPTRK